MRGLVERAAVNRMQQLVCVSRSVADFAAQYLRCDPARLTVIPNGVDLSHFATATPVDWRSIGWPADAVVSLFVGRLHPQKGIDLLQQQLDLFAPRGSRRRLLLIGEGPLNDRIDRWIAKVGEDRVQRLPWQADVAPWIKASRLLVLPSRYEGMPNVVLEAMASARPVVCSRVEGIEELLGDAFSEQSFTPDAETGLRAVAEPLLQDAALSERVGLENQSRVRREFSIPTMIDAYRSLYRELRETRRRDD